jgi:uncharacterized protein YndB with AHSA1/START domain
MKAAQATIITVRAEINVPVEKAWRLWTHPHHILHWNNASADWHTSFAESDLNKNGRFVSRMEARDGGIGFDFSGVFNEVKQNDMLSYTMDDGRKAEVRFEGKGGKTVVTESFEAEGTHPMEMQREGWQAILDNFKRYAESGNTDILQFEISIKARPATVYNVLTDKHDYQDWTKIFNPASRYEGSWEKGKEILFIGCDAEGNEGGMYSRIKENISTRFISIEHLGELQGDQKKPGDWAGTLENYSIIDEGKTTLLRIEMDSPEAFKDYFNT